MSCPFWATPLGTSCAFGTPLWYPGLFYLGYLNVRGDKSQSWSPPLPVSMHTPLRAPSGSYMDPHLFLLPAEKGRDGHYALLQSRGFWCSAGLSAKHTSMPCSHEQRWWNKLDICARMGNFYLFSPAYICSTVSKVTFQIAQRFSMDNSLPARHKRAL